MCCVLCHVYVHLCFLQKLNLPGSTILHRSSNDFDWHSWTFRLGNNWPECRRWRCGPEGGWSTKSRWLSCAWDSQTWCWAGREVRTFDYQYSSKKQRHVLQIEVAHFVGKEGPTVCFCPQPHFWGNNLNEQTYASCFSKGGVTAPILWVRACAQKITVMSLAAIN